MLGENDERIVSQVLARIPRRDFDRGDLVVPQGDSQPTVGYVERGTLKGIVHPKHGSVSEAVLTVVGEERWFGLEVFEEGHNIEYRCLTDSRLRLIPLATLTQLDEPAILRKLLAESSNIINHTIHLSYMGKLSLRTRVLSRLLDLCDASFPPEVQLTQQDLASLVGVHRNRIGIVLKDLESEGLIECGYGEITLPGRDDLLTAFAASHAAEKDPDAEEADLDD